MINKRLQLTLFLDERSSQVIEKIREEFNPQQYALIKAHVTPCREDELEELDFVLEILKRNRFPGISVDFGLAERFADGRGVLIRGVGDNSAFQELRKNLLQKFTDTPRKHEPHITLMHPRNSTCNDNIFEQIAHIELPTILSFNKISLIEQENGDAWRVLKEFDLQS